MRAIPAVFYQRLALHEGLRTLPYDDATGLAINWHLIGGIKGTPTIGAGHSLIFPISKEAVQQILEDDVAIAMHGVDYKWAWASQLDDIRYFTLTELVFAMGAWGVGGFPKMLDAMEKKDWATAADELANSAWAATVGKRADQLEAQLRSGVWA